MLLAQCFSEMLLLQCSAAVRCSDGVLYGRPLSGVVCYVCISCNVYYFAWYNVWFAIIYWRGFLSTAFEISSARKFGKTIEG